MKSMQEQQTGTNKARKTLEDSLIKANGLTYAPSSDSNVVDRRVQNEHHFDQGTYTSGQVMTCRLGNGDAYVYPKTSYLRFDITTTTNNAGFGTGSILNIFNEVELKSASGVEIDRNPHVNLFHHKKNAYTKSKDWYDGGIGSAMYHVEDARASLVAGTAVQVIVPLEFMLGVFSYDGLLPSLGFLSGSTLKISLEKAVSALYWTTGVGEYTLTNVRLVLDEYVLSDGVQKRLNELSGSRGTGLSLEWNSYFHNFTVSSAANVELQMANSVSKAVRAFAFIRDEANNVSTALADSIASQGASAITEYQFHLGNMAFPNTRVTRNTDAFVNALIAFDSFNGDPPAASRLGWLTDAPTTGWTTTTDNGTQVVAASFERHWLLGLSGYSVNADRLLRLNITKSAASERVDLFMEYIKYARVFLDRSVIKF